jgi:hypothetical protein
VRAYLRVGYGRRCRYTTYEVLLTTISNKNEDASTHTGISYAPTFYSCCSVIYSDCDHVTHTRRSISARTHMLAITNTFALLHAHHHELSHITTRSLPRYAPPVTSVRRGVSLLLPVPKRRRWSFRRSSTRVPPPVPTAPAPTSAPSTVDDVQEDTSSTYVFPFSESTQSPRHERRISHV